MKRVILLIFVLIIFFATANFAQLPQIGGFIHTLYDYECKSGENHLIAQRFWLTVRGEKDDKSHGYFAVIGDDDFLRNVFVWFKLPSLGFIPNSKISLGKFIPILGRNWPTFPPNLYTINFSQMACKSLIVRDVGATWSLDQETWGLKLSLTNGQEALKNKGLDDNKSKDVYGRLTVKPSSFVEIGTSFRHGKSQIETAKVWGADLMVGSEKFKVFGEMISSDHSEDIFGWDLLGIYQANKKIQLVVWYQKMNNKTFDTKQTLTTLGINWFIQPQTRLALNYLINSGDELLPDRALIQLQQVF